MSPIRPGGFNILPEVVKNLLIINGICFLSYFVFASALGINLNELLGLHYFGSEKFETYQLVTHLFMHGSFMHIFANMFALWMFGSLLENVWGPKRFLIFYFVTGLGAALIHSGVMAYSILELQGAVKAYISDPSYEAFHQFFKNHINYFPSVDFKQRLQKLLASWQYQPDSTAYAQQSVELAKEYLQLQKNIPTVGASGAVFGVLLAFGMMFPNQPIYLWFLFPIRAKWLVLGFGVLELYSAVTGTSAGVANFAHLGGMVIGFFLIQYWRGKLPVQPDRPMRW
jgi:membrane associated rhomboid family serine protease